ncbi:MAG: hypothetical protein AAF989_14940, partial [Planctomycetota bacterium]
RDQRLEIGASINPPCGRTTGASYGNIDSSAGADHGVTEAAGIGATMDASSKLLHPASQVPDSQHPESHGAAHPPQGFFSADQVYLQAGHLYFSVFKTQTFRVLAPL